MARYTSNRNFNIAQTFTIPKNKVKNSSKITIDSIDLWFLSKPKATGGSSGIHNPGVVVYLATTENSIPAYLFNHFARTEYAEIRTSKNASKATKFQFNSPVILNTDMEYAIIIAYDGSDDFLLWKSVKGQKLVTTGGISPGVSGPNIGNYYEWNSSYKPTRSNINVGELINSMGEQFLSSDKFTDQSWKPRVNTDLKFKVYGKRYSHNNISIDSNTSIISNNEVDLSQSIFGYNNNTYTRFALNMTPHEYIKYDKKTSIKKLDNLGGSAVYQNTVFHPGGWANNSSVITVSITTGNNIITANTKYPNGSNFSWNNLYTGSGDEYIIVVSENHMGGQRKTNIRKLQQIQSNTVMYVNEDFTISNNSANFIKSPVGYVTYSGVTKAFGKRDELLILRKSNANASCRFVNNTIESYTINHGGSGYSNSDILYIRGYENITGELQGGYLAEANLVTNTTGGITAIYFSNVGAGFVNASAITPVYSNSLANSVSNTSSGTSANISYTSGATLRAQYFGDNQYFKDIDVSNMPISEVQPDIQIQSDSGTYSKIYHQHHYIRETTANTISGYRYRAIDDPTSTRTLVKNFTVNTLQFANVPVLMSRSNQYRTLYSNGSYKTPYNPLVRSEDNAFLLVDCYSNNDYTHVKLINPDAKYRINIINNDYTNEHTDQGNSLVRHITKQFNFDRNAEDVIVYLTAYKPPGTDIKVYTRIHSDEDTEDAFDDKQWTLLDSNTSTNLYSSLADLNDYKEFEYKFPSVPVEEFTFSGSITTQLNNNEIIGSGTTFDTSNVVSGDLVRIYSPLFSNTNWMVAVVNTVTNSTHLTIDSLVTNNDIIGTMSMDKVKYTYLAFNNIQNDNVVRYYNSSKVNFDGYKSAAVKIILLSNNITIVPRVDDIKLLGVSS